MNSQPIVIKDVIGKAAQRFPALDPELLQCYIDEVISWNPRIGLVSKREVEQTVARLVSVSLFLWDQAQKLCPSDRALSVIDVGSGGGFPGVVWKLVSPPTSVLLVERREKKAAFLDRLPNILGVEGLDVFSGASQEALRLKRYRGSFDIGVTMAVSSPDRSVALVEGFLADKGIFITLISQAMEPPTQLPGGFRLTRLIKTDPVPCAVYRKVGH